MGYRHMFTLHQNNNVLKNFVSLQSVKEKQAYQWTPLLMANMIVQISTLLH